MAIVARRASALCPHGHDALQILGLRQTPQPDQAAAENTLSNDLSFIEAVAEYIPHT
jgi:hypothetical protein